MALITYFFVVLTSLECFYIFYLETIATTSSNTSRVFRIDQEELKRSSLNVLFKNQGVYNGLIGVGLLYALVLGTAKVELVQVMLVYIILVAVYGAFTSSRSILLKQGGLPILALISLFI